MLRRQRPNQRVILAGLLGGRELNAVRRKAHLRALLRDKVAHLHQLLGEDLRRRDQRLQRVSRVGHHFGVNLVIDRFQIVCLLERGMGGIGLHFCVLQLLAQHAERTVGLAKRLALRHIILRHADGVNAINDRAQTGIHRLVHLLGIAIDNRIIRDKRAELFFLIRRQRRQAFAAAHCRILQEIDKRFTLIAFFIKTPTQAYHH